MDIHGNMDIQVDLWFPQPGGEMPVDNEGQEQTLAQQWARLGIWPECHPQLRESKSWTYLLINDSWPASKIGAWTSVEWFLVYLGWLFCTRTSCPEVNRMTCRSFPAITHFPFWPPQTDLIIVYLFPFSWLFWDLLLVFAQQVAYAEIRYGAVWWVDSSLCAFESFPSWTATVPGKGSPEPCPELQIMTQLLLWEGRK